MQQKCCTNCYKSVTLSVTKVSLCPRFVPILSPRGQSENHLRPYSPKRLGTSGTKFDPISWLLYIYFLFFFSRGYKKWGQKFDPNHCLSLLAVGVNPLFDDFLDFVSKHPQTRVAVGRKAGSKFCPRFVPAGTKYFWKIAKSRVAVGRRQGSKLCPQLLQLCYNLTPFLKYVWFLLWYILLFDNQTIIIV